MKLSERFFSHIPAGVNYQITKFFIVFSDSSEKKAYFSGKRLQLHEHDILFGENFVKLTEEEAKQKHLGRVRCLGKVKDEYQLLFVLSKYYKFEAPPCYITPKLQISKTRNKTCKNISTKKIELRIDETPIDRDDIDLINKYRATDVPYEKNKIFKTILFQRGVGGKTWDQIIKNYISYNKHKFAHLSDFTEHDFYQQIVIALHTQVQKWFDTSKKCCFSTYAWYVINCSFKRQLQALSTQKRKVNQNGHLSLNDDELCWGDTISIEKTGMPGQISFEKEFETKMFYKQIRKMFELKAIDFPQYLKDEILDIIRNKTSLKQNIYGLSKKHNIDVEKLFELEYLLKNNLRNSMFNDILDNIENDLNIDETIAKKYKRSKGHVVKMRRQLGHIIKSKMKGM